MLLTMLTWTRYMVAYLNKGGRSSRVLVYIVWALCIIGVVCLILNRFYHLMFSYNEKNEYIGEVGRNVSFLLQIVFYEAITTYMIYVANNSNGRQKFRYKVVAATSMVQGIFLTFQIIYALFPCYAVGLLMSDEPLLEIRRSSTLMSFLAWKSDEPLRCTSLRLRDET